jgi:4-hydroxyphenylpyruvate dioxygenase
MRHGIATVCLSGTLEDKLAAAANAGFDGVEIFEPDLIGSRLSPEEVGAHAADLGLSIDLYQPFRDFEAVAPEQLGRNLRRAEAKFDVMRRLGATTVLVCSNVSDAAVDDDALAAEQLRGLAERAAGHGIRVAYEALAWGRHVNEYDHAWRIVQAADHPALGVCLDSFHILSRGTDLSTIAHIPPERLLFVQLADAPHLVMDVLQWSRHYRCFPGQGGFALDDFTARVLDAGYTGPLSLEVFNDVFRQADPVRMAVDARRSLLILEEQVARPAGAPPPAGARPPAAAPLPPAAPLRGYAFAELAVGPASVAATQGLLHSMGFAQVATHRSKPVALWQQGSVRVLLNAGAAPGRGIAAIAVQSTDPGRSTRRAEALLAGVLERRRGPGEAELAAVAAPDGTSIFFCDSAAAWQADSWLSDFQAAPVSGTPEATGIDRIDHIALAQPFDLFDEAALFYRSVLGLEPLGSVELAAPAGLVRSRAVTSGDGAVQLALNVPLLAGRAEDPSGMQHIALACSDIFSAARRMRAHGVQPLSIPGNYYDDLAARHDLDPQLLGALRELDILYESGAGEFLHFYTPTVDGRLFFEVVQRRGGYVGFGAANAPVRMAAQRAAALGSNRHHDPQVNERERDHGEQRAVG